MRFLVILCATATAVVPSRTAEPSWGGSSNEVFLDDDTVDEQAAAAGQGSETIVSLEAANLTDPFSRSSAVAGEPGADESNADVETSSDRSSRTASSFCWVSTPPMGGSSPSSSRRSSLGEQEGSSSLTIGAGYSAGEDQVDEDFRTEEGDYREDDSSPSPVTTGAGRDEIDRAPRSEQKQDSGDTEKTPLHGKPRSYYYLFFGGEPQPSMDRSPLSSQLGSSATAVEEEDPNLLGSEMGRSSAPAAESEDHSPISSDMAPSSAPAAENVDGSYLSSEPGMSSAPPAEIQSSPPTSKAFCEVRLRKASGVTNQDGVAPPQRVVTKLLLCRPEVADLALSSTTGGDSSNTRRPAEAHARLQDPSDLQGVGQRETLRGSPEKGQHSHGGDGTSSSATTPSGGTMGGGPSSDSGLNSESSPYVEIEPSCAPPRPKRPAPPKPPRRNRRPVRLVVTETTARLCDRSALQESDLRQNTVSDSVSRAAFTWRPARTGGRSDASTQTSAAAMVMVDVGTQTGQGEGDTYPSSSAEAGAESGESDEVFTDSGTTSGTSGSDTSQDSTPRRPRRFRRVILYS